MTSNDMEIGYMYSASSLLDMIDASDLDAEHRLMRAVLQGWKLTIFVTAVVGLGLL